MNTDRNKLFFFYNTEITPSVLPRLTDGSGWRVRLPQVLETLFLGCVGILDRVVGADKELSPVRKRQIRGAGPA